MTELIAVRHYYCFAIFSHYFLWSVILGAAISAPPLSFLVNFAFQPYRIDADFMAFIDGSAD